MTEPKQFYSSDCTNSVPTNDELRRKVADILGIEYEELTFVVGNDYVIKDDNDDMYKPLPDWPVSIADAWGLVEEMRNEHEIDIASDKLSDGSSTYCMKIFTFRGDGKGTGWRLEHITTADTAPRAICLAYLEWKRECSANSDSTP